MTSSAIFISLVGGCCAGATAALCGVGGGIILVPFLVFFLGLEQKSAVATSLAAIILTAIAASLKNHGNQLVQWPIALTCGVAAALVAWFAADALKVLSNQILTRGFAILLIAVGVRMLLQK